MKKIILLSLVVVCILLAGCAGDSGKYGDVKKIINDYIGAHNKFATDIEKANDAKAVAAALKTYTKEMKRISPLLESIPDKYPELAGPEPPAELKNLITQMENVEDVLEKSYNKIMGYSADPAVTEAMEEMGF
ncbi:MAG: hypothetical protein JW881_20660 [Spirochaetales bacterium]|nr:hypothetical protein [Spirochaetales bacterium]